MQGGAPNSANPYGGYQANTGTGGYNPQQQPLQPHQVGMHGYAAQAGRGGYYPQQQQPQQQQQYGGYPTQVYGQGYVPRGGYQLQPQQQGSYVPRGGYYQGGYDAGAPQGYGGAAPMNRGGYGQGYYPQQQQQQRGYYNQGYIPNNQYGQMSRGGFQGGAYRGGQGFNSPPQQGGGRGGQGDFQRGGRGGRSGRGGRGGHGGGRSNETFALIHLDSYAQLEEAGRKGATEEMVPTDVLASIRARSRGGPIRLLVVIQKKYAAACLSLPRHSDDALLSEKTAETFMQVPCVTANHGNRLVDVANGGYLQGAIYNVFRNLMVTLTPFDKPRAAPVEDATASQTAATDVQEKPTDELLEALTKDVATYEAVLTAMSADSDESTKLFARLMRLDVAEEEGDHGRDHDGDDDGDNDDNADEDAGEDVKEAEKAAITPAAATVGAGANAAAVTQRKPRHTLMSSPQGIQILRAALAVGSKRQVFFEKLTPPPAKTEADPLARLEWSTSLRLLNPLFQYPLLSDLLYQLFGLVPVGAQDMKAAKPKTAELKILCEALVRYGVYLSSSAASGNTILSLLHAVDPQQAKIAAAEQAAEEAAKKPGMKRGRDAEEPAGASAADDAAQKVKTEESKATSEAPSGAKEQVHAPASLAEYKEPAAPQDWHLYYALAESWCTGELPELHRKKTRFNAPAQAEADSATAAAAAAQKPATVEARLQHVSRNVTGSFLVRYMIPVFSDAVLTALKSPANHTKEHDAFVRNCETLLSAMAASWTTTDPTYTDGYIYRSLLKSLAARAVPGTPVEAALSTLNKRIVNTIFESSREKYHSHCVQEALTVARQTKDGDQFVLQVARALMEKGDEVLLSLAVSPSGNYVVRHLCDQLTEYATGMVTAAEAEVVEEAKELETKYFKFMTTNLAKLSSVQFGRGLVGWQRDQTARLAQPSAFATPAAPTA